MNDECRMMNDEGKTAAPEPSSVSLALTGGLAIGGKLRENRLFAVSPTGLVLQGEMTLEQWRETLRMVKWTKSASALWLADLIRHGREHFGEAEVKESLIQLEFDLTDVARSWAIEKLDDWVRHVALTAEHYYVLSRAELAPAQQVIWARLAVKHGLTALQLQKSIAAGEVVSTKEIAQRRGGGSGLATPHGIRQQFELWYAQVNESEPIDRWDDERKRELLEELRAPAVLGVRLARELGVELEEDKETRGQGDTETRRVGGSQSQAQVAELVKQVLVEREETGVGKDWLPTVAWVQRRLRIGYTAASGLLPRVLAALEGGAA